MFDLNKNDVFFAFIYYLPDTQAIFLLSGLRRFSPRTISDRLQHRIFVIYEFSSFWMPQIIRTKKTLHNKWITSQKQKLQLNQFNKSLLSLMFSLHYIFVREWFMLWFICMLTSRLKAIQFYWIGLVLTFSLIHATRISKKTKISRFPLVFYGYSFVGFGRNAAFLYLIEKLRILLTDLCNR